MPRTARVVFPGVSVHVIQRGNNRGRCFFCDADYRAYLRYLRKFSQTTDCLVHAYCLMTNHVHLLITPGDVESCARLMKNLGQHYVQYVNRVHGRSGTLWEGRFRSCVAASPYYVLACYRYIEMNPVRAGMVAHPREYPWSSYCTNAEGQNNPLLVPHMAYVDLVEDPQRSRLAYFNLVASALEPSVVEDIRKAARGGHTLGVERKGRGRPSKKMGSVPIFEAGTP